MAKTKINTRYSLISYLIVQSSLQVTTQTLWMNVEWTLNFAIKVSNSKYTFIW